jgi:hypothetical protein
VRAARLAADDGTRSRTAVLVEERPLHDVDHLLGAVLIHAGRVNWQEAGAADGFSIMGSTLPRELVAFAERVVPIVQTRGATAASTREARCASTSGSTGVPAPVLSSRMTISGDGGSRGS